MTNNDLISIIIPIYNTEKYLEEALNSFLEQTYENYEMILVDDGSTDGSGEIIREYQDKDSRIKAIFQKNKGVSGARNEGIRQASGKYIVFWDSDDTVPCDALEALYNNISENSSDLSCGGVAEGDAMRIVEPKGATNLAEKPVIDRYDRNFIYSLSVCNKIFRRDIIVDNSLEFRKLRFLEDGDFLMRYVALTEKITGCNQIVYNIRWRPFWETPSTTQQGTETLFDECKDAVTCIRDSIRKMEDTDREKLLKENASEEELAAVTKKANTMIDTLYYRFASINVINSFYRLIWKNETDYTAHINRILGELLRTISKKRKRFLVSNNPDLDLRKPLPDQIHMDRKPILTVIITEAVGRSEINNVIGALYAQRLPSFNMYISSRLQDAVSEEFAGRINLHFYNKKEVQGIAGTVRRTRAKYVTLIDRPLMWEAEGFRMMVADMVKSKAYSVYAGDGISEDGGPDTGGLYSKVFRTRAVRSCMKLIERNPVGAFAKAAELPTVKGSARVYIGSLEKLK